MSVLNELIEQIEDKNLRDRISEEVSRLSKQKKFGLVFEEHLPECTPLWDIPVKKGGKVALKAGHVSDFYTVLKIEDGVATCLNKDKSATADFAVDELVSVAEFGEPIYPYLKPLDTVCNAPDSDLWHTLIEADNYHALQLLEYLYAGKVDCIYIDPPYNTGARDWKYNNDYVDNSDQYRHSKWLSMMQKRLRLAKKLLNPKDATLIVTIDEKEQAHLFCLLEEIFPEARIQMISNVINRKGVAKTRDFSRCDEYIFFVMLGEAAPAPTKDNMLDDESLQKQDKVEGTTWIPMRRAGTNSLRKDRPKLFYPIYVDKKSGRICSTGEALSADLHIDSNFIIKGDMVEIWPIKASGEEGRWQLQGETVLKRVAEGTVRAVRKKGNDWIIQYLNEGALKEIQEGTIQIMGKDSNGTLVVERNASKVSIAKSIWNRTSHDATAHGTNLINKILVQSRFSFPKSLYAERDTINFIVANKPNALIIDFFAGSGTTMHAVNLLNSEDGGHRRCILVTNNEVSESEVKEMTQRGLMPGDEEWEKYGIARYVTWPRTVCSIEGHDVNGNPLKGNYLGSNLPMEDGFKANAAFFKLGFLDKNSVALGKQFKKMLPTLWMKSGAHGPCPTISEETPDMLILPKNKFAVLVDERQYMGFAEKLDTHPGIETVFIVTDSESGYRDMIAGLNVKETYQLYRDYLDNFRINAARR